MELFSNNKILWNGDQKDEKENDRLTLFMLSWKQNQYRIQWIFRDKIQSLYCLPFFLLSVVATTTESIIIKTRKKDRTKWEQKIMKEKNGNRSNIQKIMNNFSLTYCNFRENDWNQQLTLTRTQRKRKKKKNNIGHIPTIRTVRYSCWIWRCTRKNTHLFYSTRRYEYLISTTLSWKICKLRSFGLY